MSIVPLLDLPDLLPAGTRLLGVDVGTKRIGLAVADVSRTIATPLETIARTRLDRDLDRLAQCAAEVLAGGFVVGLPVEMDGREGRRCQAVRQFAGDLLKRIDAPLAFWDERLSTAAVERVLIKEADLSRQRRRQVVDKTAACFILQGALDRLAYAARKTQKVD
jgi:putative Holliday junction resolvase